MSLCAQFACALFGIASCLGFATEAAAQTTNPPVLTSASQVRSLSASEASRKIPAELTGVVIDPSEPSGRALVIADDTACIYVLADRDLFDSYKQGDLVEVEGFSDPGEFAPIVRVNSARKTGIGKIPAPKPATYQQVISGSTDGQWIEIAGVVRRILDGRRILLATEGGIIPVRTSPPLDPSVQEDSEVRVHALCLYQFNRRRQAITPILQVPSGVPVVVTSPAPKDPFAIPVRSANSLMQFSPESPSGHRIHVRGVVTHAQTGSLVWIRDATSGLCVQTRQANNLKPGDLVDVLGYPTFGSYAPVLEHAMFRKVASTNPPAPIRLESTAQALQHENDLVSTPGLLMDVQATLDGTLLTLSTTNGSYRALLRNPAERKEKVPWVAGSELRVTGICDITYDDPRPLTGVWRPQSFQILLRSPLDVEVVKPAPWWTPHRITVASVGGSATLLLGMGIIIFLSRRRVLEQDRQRKMAEAEFSAILAERNRVAREIHDTLAQGLTATSVQLSLAKKHVNGSSPQLEHHLSSAQDLVRGSLQDARNSIWNMRSQVLEQGDLADALKGILQRMTDGTGISTEFKASGEVRRLAPVVENNVLRIGQEAITNAWKHSKGKRVEVDLLFGEKRLELIVQDNGVGFDTEKEPGNGESFGVVGMRERAAAIQGELKLSSRLGQGTIVRVSVPLGASA